MTRWTARRARRVRLAVWQGRVDAATVRLTITSSCIAQGVAYPSERSYGWLMEAYAALYALELVDVIERRHDRLRSRARGRALRLPCCLVMTLHSH